MAGEEEESESRPLILHISSSSVLSASPPTSQPVTYTSTIVYFMALHFLIAFTEMVLVAPVLRLEERALCIQYYNTNSPHLISPDGTISESLCKIIEVQEPLAKIRGWKSLLDCVPVLIVAIPLGNFGDTFGRRLIMAGSFLGVFLSLSVIFVVCKSKVLGIIVKVVVLTIQGAFPMSFDLRYIYLSSVLLLLGGGLYSTTSFMWAFAAECLPEKSR